MIEAYRLVHKTGWMLIWTTSRSKARKAAGRICKRRRLKIIRIYKESGDNNGKEKNTN